MDTRRRIYRLQSLSFSQYIQYSIILTVEYIQYSTVEREKIVSTVQYCTVLYPARAPGYCTYSIIKSLYCMNFLRESSM